MFTQYYGRSTSKDCGHAKFYAILWSEYFESLRSCKIYAILWSEYFEGLRSCKIYAILRSEYFEGLRSCKFAQYYGRSTLKVCSHAKFTQYYGQSTSKVYGHVNLRNIMVEVLRKLASGNFLRLVNISKYFDVILRFIVSLRIVKT